MSNRVSELRIHHAQHARNPRRAASPTADHSPSAKEARRRVAVIHGPALIRQSLAQALQAASGEETEGFESVEAWLRARR